MHATARKPGGQAATRCKWPAGCPRLRLGPQEARAAPPPASCLQLFRHRGAALRQAAAALHHTRCTCRAACRLRVPVEHAADQRLRGRKITGLPARARHDERRAPPWPAQVVTEIVALAAIAPVPVPVVTFEKLQ
eukprot:scaffold25890_cov26-Phaeocystis_antarctica.AAC.1